VVVFRCAVALVALVALVATATRANAENAKTGRPGFDNLRYEEDWSVLRGGVEPEGVFDPIKYIPFDEDGQFWLSMGGQLRARLEIWNNFNFGGSTPKADDSYVLGRVRLHADLHLTEYFRAFAEFKSAFLTDRQLAGGRRTSDEDLAALQNAFGEIRVPGDGWEAGVQGGRRELQLGTQKLVSPLDWANARRTFDGASAFASGDGWHVDGFWSRLVIVEKKKFNKSSNAEQLYGIYGNLPELLPELDLDLYWLGLHLDQPRATNGTPGRVNRQTIGGRLFGTIPKTPVEVELEGAGQFGTVGREDISAGMFSSLFTLPFESTPLTPAIYTGYDYASGDSGAGGSVGTFDQLYPLVHAYLGLIDLVARQNIHAVQLGAQVSPLKRGVFKMTWHSFWLADGNDALYNAPGQVLRLDPTATSRHVGAEVDLTFTYVFVRGFDTLIGYSHFFPGNYISQSGPDEDQDFFYLSLQYTF
jgi:hypothetical protein